MKQYCHLSYRIPFSETDAMGIVHHANHPNYLERGRVEFLRLAGLGYGEIVKQGLHFPLTDLRLSYKRPILFDEIILVETSISLASRMRVTFEYKIFRAQEILAPALSNSPLAGKPSVIGETLHCCVNNAGRPVEIVPSMLATFQKLGNL